MVLAALLLFHALYLFVLAAKPLDTWPLAGIMTYRTYGSILLLASILDIVLALLLMANTIIGRWLAVGYAVLVTTGFLVWFVGLSMAHDVLLPTFFTVRLLVLIIGEGLLLGWMAYPRPEERRLHRQARHRAPPLPSLEP